MRTKRVHTHVPELVSLHRALWMTGKLMIKTASLVVSILGKIIGSLVFILFSNPRGAADLIADQTGEYRRSYHEFEIKL